MPPKRRYTSGTAGAGKRVKRRQPSEEEDGDGIGTGTAAEPVAKAKETSTQEWIGNDKGKGKGKAVLFPLIVNGKDEDKDMTSQSSLTKFSSSDFDIDLDDPSTSKSKAIPKSKSKSKAKGKGKWKGKAPPPPPDHNYFSDDSSDDMEWEDVLGSTITSTTSANGESSTSALPATGDLELTLDKSSSILQTSTKKKGASSTDRRVRILTHCMHVQFLLFYGAIRNSWCCDREVQGILLSLLTPVLMREIERYQSRQESHLSPPKDLQSTESKSSKNTKSSKNIKGTKDPQPTPTPATLDPLLKLLGTLLHWWKKKFTISAPALRKYGYKPLSQFVADRSKPGEKFMFTTGRKDKDGKEVFTIFDSLGERIEGLEGFRELAGRCEGSLDTSAALFTALCRALGMEARLVVSLQPLGFGFGIVEEAVKDGDVGKAENTDVKGKGKEKVKRKKVESSSEDEDEDEDEDASDTETETDAGPQKKNATPDKDLPYPTTWTEIYSPHTQTWLSLTSFPRPFLAPSTVPLHPTFEPKGQKATAAKQQISYVIAYTSSGTAVDVTPKYLSKPWPGKTKGFRIPVSDVPVYGYDGRTVVEVMKRDWFDGVMRGYRKPQEKMDEKDRKEEMELKELRERGKEEEDEKKRRGGGEDSIGFYKNNPNYVLERHLKREEAILPGRNHVRTLTIGKGEKAKTEKVYSRDDIVVCKAVENWFKEGRMIKEGEQPLKQVKRRAATISRRREIEEREREGEVVMQGLYSLEQTKLYEPPPITDGKIPRNAFGNMDVYVPSMIPKGAVHVPLKGSAKVARKLGIEYAEAVTGFEFKKQRAVPHIEGVIVAAENADLLRDAWTADDQERRRKEDVKREAEALALRRRVLMGLSINKRLGEEYGDLYAESEGRNPFVRRDAKDKRSDGAIVKNGEEEGGFARDHEDDGGGFADDAGKEGGVLGDAEEEGGFLKGAEEEGGFLKDADEEGGFLRDVDEEGCFLKNADGDDGGGFVEGEGGDEDGGGGFIVELEEDEKEERKVGLGNGQVMSLRDMIARQSEGNTRQASSASESESDSEDNASPELEVRSAYFTTPAQASSSETSAHKDPSEDEPPKSTKPSQRGRGKSRGKGSIRETGGSRGRKARNVTIKAEVAGRGDGRRRSSRLSLATRSKYFVGDDDGDDEEEEEFE